MISGSSLLAYYRNCSHSEKVSPSLTLEHLCPFPSPTALSCLLRGGSWWRRSGFYLAPGSVIASVSKVRRGGGGANAAGVRDSPRTGAHSSLTVRCLVTSSVPSCVQEGHFAYKHVSQTCSWEFLWWRLFCFFANTKAKAEQNQSPSWR